MSRRKGPLALSDFRPKSMLHVPVTRVETPRYAPVDTHTHLSFASQSSGGVDTGDEVTFVITPEAALEVMDRKGHPRHGESHRWQGEGARQGHRRFRHGPPGSLLHLCPARFRRPSEPALPAAPADAIEAAARAGAKGLKVLKNLGLYLREQVTEGPLVKVDDPRFDPMWEACAAHDLPVFIHVADPEAFFLPIDCTNERWDELGNHPDWSFHGRDFPSFREILEARDRVYARHPKTQFLSLHFGHGAENLAFVGESLDRFPNMTVELGARIAELGRQPRASRQFFERYQDRILFGTDAVPPPEGEKYPQQVFKDELYEIYYRFLETEDEYFDYAPAPVPPQGTGKIYGLGLPDAILKKVYRRQRRARYGAGVMSATTLLLVCLLAAPLAVAAAAPEYKVARTTAARDSLSARRRSRGPGPLESPGARAGTKRGSAPSGTTRGSISRFEVTDPNPWHTMTKKDEHLWDEEVVEIFIDPNNSGRDYYELEINPATWSATCDGVALARKGERHRLGLRGARDAGSRTDRRGRNDDRLDRRGVPPRGAGSVGSPSARDVALPPKPDDAWRVNVFRIKRPGGPGAPEKDAVLAAWSPPSAGSFHDPGAFRPFTFQAAP